MVREYLALRSFLKLFLLQVTTVVLVSCGGGGGSGSTESRSGSSVDDTPNLDFSFDGKTSPAILSSQLLASATYNQVFLNLFSLSISENIEYYYDLSLSNLDETRVCDSSGEVKLLSNNDGEQHSFSMEFDECNDGAFTSLGKITVTFTFDPALGSIPSMNTKRLTIDIKQYVAFDGKEVVGINGLATSATSYFEGVLEWNAIAQSEIGEKVKFEHYLVPKNRYTSNDEKLTGRLFVADNGYVDLALDAPLEFNSDGELIAFGDMHVSNEENIVGSVQFLGADTIWLGIENLTSNEQQGVSIKKDQLAVSPIKTESRPTAKYDVGSDFDLFGVDLLNQGSVYIDGRFSTDSNLDDLRYSWDIISKPDESGAFIVDENLPVAQFQPDKLGAYAVSLQVFDGAEYSDPVIVDINLGHDGNIVMQATYSQSVPGAVGSPNEIPRVNGHMFSIDVSDSYELFYEDRSPYTIDYLNYQLSARFLNKPVESRLDNIQVGDERVYFTPDVAGRYTVEVELNNGIHSRSFTRTIDFEDYDENFKPRLRTGNPNYQFGIVGEQVEFEFFDNSLRYSPEVDEYKWRLLDIPESSGLSLFPTNNSSVQFSPDVPGIYLLEIAGSNGFESDSKIVEIYVRGSRSFEPTLSTLLEQEILGNRKQLDLITTGDIDGNGYSEIFIPGSVRSVLLRQDETGFLARENWDHDYLQYSAITNINNDDKDELLVYMDQFLGIYSYDIGQGIMLIDTIEGVSPFWSPKYLDFDNDGDIDVLKTPNRSDNEEFFVDLYVNDGAFSFSSVNIGVGYHIVPETIAFGFQFFDEDELIDVYSISARQAEFEDESLRTHYFDSEFKVYAQLNDGGFSVASELSFNDVTKQPAMNYEIKDLNNDSEIDVVGSYVGEVGWSFGYWLKKQNSSELEFVESLLDSVVYQYDVRDSFVEDFNLDGKMDIAIRTTNALYIFYQTDGVTFKDAEHYEIPQGHVSVNDIDGDGDLDIITGHAEGSSDRITVYSNMTLN